LATVTWRVPVADPMTAPLTSSSFRVTVRVASEGPSAMTVIAEGQAALRRRADQTSPVLAGTSWVKAACAGVTGAVRSSRPAAEVSAIQASSLP
jgi:hypothetical protein